MSKGKGAEQQQDTGVVAEEHFKLINPQLLVDQTLEMTGFNKILEAYTNLEIAVASF